MRGAVKVNVTVHSTGSKLGLTRPLQQLLLSVKSALNGLTDRLSTPRLKVLLRKKETHGELLLCCVHGPTKTSKFREGAHTRI